MIIRFMTGPLKGQEFSVRKGLILSRNSREEGDIALEDPKASNPHAEIVKKNRRFYFKDRDSKNGTYIEGEINDCFVLKPGLRFEIGKTVLEVFKPLPKPKTWPEIVQEELTKLKLKDRPKKLEPFAPSLKLKFKSGAQKGDLWRLRYGPRRIGPNSLDLKVLEPQAPEICFSLSPQKNSALFKTLYPEKVLLNKKHISKKTLKSGDLISFGGSCIEVGYESQTKKIR